MDRHILVVDRDNGKLYELFAAYPSGAGYSAGSGAIFDLSSNALRPAGWTSADAAGLPIFPGLVRYALFRAHNDMDLRTGRTSRVDLYAYKMHTDAYANDAEHRR